jgi:hypothetical protein
MVKDRKRRMHNLPSIMQLKFKKKANTMQNIGKKNEDINVYKMNYFEEFKW